MQSGWFRATMLIQKYSVVTQTLLWCVWSNLSWNDKTQGACEDFAKPWKRCSGQIGDCDSPQSWRNKITETASFQQKEGPIQFAIYASVCTFQIWGQNGSQQLMRCPLSGRKLVTETTNQLGWVAKQFGIKRRTVHSGRVSAKQRVFNIVEEHISWTLPEHFFFEILRAMNWLNQLGRFSASILVVLFCRALPLWMLLRDGCGFEVVWFLFDSLKWRQLAWVNGLFSFQHGWTWFKFKRAWLEFSQMMI